jgi:hypothetical protein
MQRESLFSPTPHFTLLSILYIEDDVIAMFLAKHRAYTWIAPCCPHPPIEFFSNVAS